MDRLPSLIVFLVLSPFSQAQDIEKLEKQRAPKPNDLALIFSNGYAGDTVPKDDDQFEKLLVTLKEAHFNVIYCTYTDSRLKLCKKHGIKMMVDLLAPEHHVYKSADKAQAVCEKLKGNPDVWGYNLWNDPVRKTGEGRRRDVNTVRGWDDTHLIFSGTYRTEGMNHVVNADILGYYDFHWKRGVDQHFPHQLAFSKWAKDRDSWYYSWLSATSGIAGKGNFNRNLWSANTSLACGMKGILWFLGDDLMNAKTLEWKEAGRDIIKVHERIAPLGKEIAPLGLPVAIHSTFITKTSNNDALPKGMDKKMPPGLEKHGFPVDYWLQPSSGEFMIGVFKDAKKRDVVMIANHNAYAEQKVALTSKNTNVSLFNRKTGKWVALQSNQGTVSLTLEPGDGDLLRYGE